MTARALAVIALAAGLSHPAGAQAVTPATVHAPGGPFLTDDAGRRLELHGVNLVPECGPHTSPSKADGTPCLPDPKANEPGWYLTRHARDPGRRFTDADAETLRSLGIDVVRLGIHWEAMEPGPPGIGANDATYCRHLLPGQPHDESLGSKLWSPAIADRYLGHVDREIRMLERHHLEVILDMHSGAYSNFFYKTTGSTPWLGHGAPLWATCDDNIPFTPPDAWNSSYFTPAVADAADHFWSNDVAVNMQEEYIRTWTHVVRRYAGSKLASGIIGYEIANEPVELTEASPPAFDRKVQCDYAGSDYAPASCASSLPATHPQQVGIIPSIQQVDPKRLVFYEPPILTGEGSPETIGTGEPLPFDGLVLSFHSYATDEANFNEAAAARAATMTKQPGGPAWMNTEFGASDLDAENSRAVAQADQHLVPWTYWA
ncbi:MAG: cellulase family glycosylhydrolase, partial [Actinobacteria bacterium]|nr:cellulase family glycosylhydrolase [Actinomycetota bacterium]